MLTVSAVGGSIRNSNSHWRIDCHQVAWQNFTMNYKEGYNESIHDCLYCDYTEGSFLAKTNVVKKVKFDSNLPYSGLFEDFFLRLNGETIVCPDSMFYVENPEYVGDACSFQTFAFKHNLYQMVMSGVNINFGCSYKYPCNKLPGLIEHPCCVQELTNLINGIMAACSESEPHAGTMVGALKLNHALSWERDGDIKLFGDNFMAVEKNRKLFEK